MSTIQENWTVDADGQVINEKGVVIAGNIRNINHSFLISKIPDLCRQVLHMQSQLELAALSLVDILPTLKDGDSSYETAMPDRKNVPCCVNIAFVSATTLNTSPFSYLQTA